MALNPQLQHLQDFIVHSGGGASELPMVQEGEEEWPASPSDDNFKVCAGKHACWCACASIVS